MMTISANTATMFKLAAPVFHRRFSLSSAFVVRSAHANSSEQKARPFVARAGGLSSRSTSSVILIPTRQATDGRNELLRV